MVTKPQTASAEPVGTDFRSYFLPVLLIKIDEDGGSRIVECFGTASFFAPNMIVTCWHCVKDEPPPGHRYALRLTNSDGTVRALPLSNIERDANGTDMATAICNQSGANCLVLAEKPPMLGENVYTVGYPFSGRTTNEKGESVFEVTGRMLKTYIARSIYYQHPDHGRTGVYELGAAAPLGMSGGAVLHERTLVATGIIFASRDAETIEEFASVDAVTGEREPEVRRIVSFALAYDLDELSALRTSATNNRPLAEFLREQKEKEVAMP